MTECQYHCLNLILEGFKAGVLVLASKSTLRGLRARRWLRANDSVSYAGQRALDRERHRRVSHV